MPRFHAGFSVGTVAGALIGALMVALHVPVTVHLLGIAAVVAATMPVAVQAFLPDDAADSRPTGRGRREPNREAPLGRAGASRAPCSSGSFVLAFAFAEGTGNDWISVALIDGYHVPAAVGTLGFAAVPGRDDDRAVVRTGVARPVRARRRCVRLLAGRRRGLAAVRVRAGGRRWPSSARCCGASASSLGFPVGMSAGADDPAARPAG